MLNIVAAVHWRDFVEAILLLSVPTTFCLLIWFKSPLVRSFGRVTATMAVFSLFGWAVMVGCVFLGPAPDNGFATFCALVFGWAYAWIIGLPVLVLSFCLRAIFFRRRATEGEPQTKISTMGVVLFLFMSLVVYPACLCVRPSEMWKEWGSRQYRVRSFDGIVHVQIREAGKTTNVRSDASSYHRFNVEPVSAEELRLDSSDVGVRIIRKVGGNWELESDENGQK